MPRPRAARRPRLQLPPPCPRAGLAADGDGDRRLRPPAGSRGPPGEELRREGRLVRFFLGRGTVNGRRILAPASVERGESTLAGRSGLTTGYGLGNAPLFDEGITFRGHNGGIDSFTSLYGYAVRNGSGYVVMANGGRRGDLEDPTPIPAG